MKNIKRILVFALAFVILVSAVPGKEVFAAYSKYSEPLLPSEVIKRISGRSDLDLSVLDSQNLVSYFVIKNESAGLYYLVGSKNTRPWVKFYRDSKVVVYLTSASDNNNSDSFVNICFNSNGIVSARYSVDYLSSYVSPDKVNDMTNFTIVYASIDFNLKNESSKYVSCSVAYSDLLNAHTCSFVTNETAPTCTTSGSTWQECSCGERQNVVEIPALGHTWVQQSESGNCTVDSRTWEQCSVCNAVQNEVVTPASGHVWIEMSEPATCTEAGSSWEECGCGERQNVVEIPALGHTWVQQSESGSCTVDSRTWEQCSVCNTLQNEVITPASGHVYDNDNDEFCNVCSYCRNIERLGVFLDMVPIILSLFWIFPLNVFLIAYLIILSTIIYRRMKKK